MNATNVQPDVMSEAAAPTTPPKRTEAKGRRGIEDTEVSSQQPSIYLMIFFMVKEKECEY